MFTACTVAIDGDDDPVVVYVSRLNQTAIARHDGGEWTEVALNANAGGPLAAETSLALIEPVTGRRTQTPIG